jgi:hypothetical protein
MRRSVLWCGAVVVGAMAGLVGGAAPTYAEGAAERVCAKPRFGDFFAGMRKAFDLDAGGEGAEANLEPPQCEIACQGKDVKIVILAENVLLPLNPVLAQADYELSYCLTRMLKQQYEENKDRVKIVSTAELKAYKNTHPKWREQTAQEIGKHFGADFVISLEIDESLLYDERVPPSYSGGCMHIDVTVTDVHKPIGDGEKFHCPYSLEYPRAPLERTDMNVNQFHAKLIERVCKDLVQFFAAHPPKDKYDE